MAIERPAGGRDGLVTLKDDDGLESASCVVMLRWVGRASKLVVRGAGIVVYGRLFEVFTACPLSPNNVQPGLSGDTTVLVGVFI